MKITLALDPEYMDSRVYGGNSLPCSSEIVQFFSLTKITVGYFKGGNEYVNCI